MATNNKPDPVEEKKAPEDKAPEVKPVPPTPSSAAGPDYDGKQLKKAREAKGLSIEDVATRTKITMKVLRALEDERYEDMPNARVYIWGFVRCVAREIGIDQDRVSQTYVPRWEAWVASRAEP